MNRYNVIRRKTQKYRDGASFPEYSTMRFPEKYGKIEWATAQELVDRAMSAGINYFGRTYQYHNGESGFPLSKVQAKYSHGF